MPRGRKSLTLEEQLAAIETKIAETQKQLEEYTAQKKSIEATIKEEKLNTLLTAIQDKGISLEDAIAKINA